MRLPSVKDLDDKYPLPEEYEWIDYDNDYAVTIAYKESYQPKEIMGKRSEAWVKVDTKGFFCHVRASLAGTKPKKTFVGTADEALKYIHTWILLGMNRSEE